MNVSIYTTGDSLPPGLMEDNFFHSPAFFTICQQTPRHRPYMVALSSDSGQVVAQMLAVVRYRSSWFPPYYYQHCSIMGEGVYSDEGGNDDEGGDAHRAPLNSTAKAVRERMFGQMLHALTAKLGPRMLYVEMSHLSHKMFGYRQLRDNRYFPVRWMSIHNSLHSRTPEERISERMQRHIDAAYQRGVITDEVHTDDDFREFMKLLRHHNWLKPKRYIPADEFFHQLWKPMGNGNLNPNVNDNVNVNDNDNVNDNVNACLFLTRYHGHIVGCSAVAYSQRQAYLWFAAYRRKSFPLARPRELTVWHAIKHAHAHGCQHIYFMDVGLPFRRNKFREFILRFGGKPESTYRWFRCSIKWVNSLLSWFYRD